MARTVPIDDDALAEAADLLRAGALVAFPTETVYGLGADATNDASVAAIFAAKNRPAFNPLIVHLPDLAAAESLAVFDVRAREVADAFWPGPLSLVLPRATDCPLSRLVSAGLDTVALRLPSSVLARKLLVQAGVPIAAPSANKSGDLSPTEARHVGDAFGDEVSLVLDGGACAVGLESTVLDLSAPRPVLLRAGGITLEALAELLGEEIAIAGSDDDAPRSPGMMSRHYAPATPLRMNADHAADGEALLGFGSVFEDADLNLSPAGDLVEAAANLFGYLHALDSRGRAGIAVVPIPENGLGRAINDRLRRAAAGPSSQ